MCDGDGGGAAAKREPTTIRIYPYFYFHSVFVSKSCFLLAVIYAVTYTPMPAMVILLTLYTKYTSTVTFIYSSIVSDDDNNAANTIQCT